ncbi:MAG: C40 family peptidase [Epulopiscium sp.]|nr:C40 family peptidase [Candidatus Epulonipiscium sp.]
MNIKKAGIIFAGFMGSLLFGSTVYAESYATLNVPVLNIRQAPLEFASVVGAYQDEEIVKIIDESLPGWYLVERSPGRRNYISSEYVDIFKVKATISGDGINSRVLPKGDARINKQLYDGEEISVFYRVGEWCYVGLVGEELNGYVHSNYIDSDFLYLLPERDISEAKEVEIIVTPEKTEEENKGTESKEDKPVVSSSKGQSVVNYAKQFVGNPYVYGGNSLTNGVDCSGFTQQVMKKAGVSLQRSSAAQYASNGVKVSVDNIQPGDLIFYGYNGQVSHVGIYAGNNKIVHASNAKTGITMGEAFRTRGKPIIGVKRVL